MAPVLVLCVLLQAAVVHGCRRRHHLLQRQQPAQPRQRRGALAAGGPPFLPASTDRTLRKQGRSAAARRDVIGEPRRDVIAESPARVRQQGPRREGRRADWGAEVGRMFGEDSTRSARCFSGSGVGGHQLSTTT